MSAAPDRHAERATVFPLCLRAGGVDVPRRDGVEVPVAGIG
jgi:hypothetical protein